MDLSVPCIVEGRSELRNAARVNCKTHWPFSGCGTPYLLNVFDTLQFSFKKIAVRLVECSLLYTDFAYCWFYFSFFFSLVLQKLFLFCFLFLCFFFFFFFKKKRKTNKKYTYMKTANKTVKEKKIERKNQMPNRFFLPRQVFKHKLSFLSCHVFKTCIFGEECLCATTNSKIFCFRASTYLIMCSKIENVILWAFKLHSLYTKRWNTREKKKKQTKKKQKEKCFFISFVFSFLFTCCKTFGTKLFFCLTKLFEEKTRKILGKKVKTEQKCC